MKSESSRDLSRLFSADKSPRLFDLLKIGEIFDQIHLRCWTY